MIRLAFILTGWATVMLSGAEASSWDKLQGLNQPQYHKLESDILDRPFHIFIRSPESYNDTDRRYPVIYLLDGGHTFPMLASYYRYLVFEEEIPEAIVVGVSYGVDATEDGNLRGTDFTAPAPDREPYGGAERFQQVLAEELAPYIETHYRADPARRIIFGQSLGGQFVLYTALSRPDLFWGHIASNPALHRNLPFFLDFEFSGLPTASRLFVSSGSLDEARFREPLGEWVAHWRNAENKPWTLKTVTLEGESHFSAAPAAFRSGLLWLFSEGEDQ